MPILCRVFAACLSLLALASPVQSGDHWPQWRGPEQNGTSDAEGLPVRWGPDEHVLWKTPLPAWSAATPIIWGERVFVMSPSAGASDGGDGASQGAADEDRPRRRGRGRRGRSGSGRSPGGDALLLLCASRKDGRILWTRKIDEGNALHRKGNNTSPSPVTDGEHVWAVTGTGVVAAMDMEGKELWRTDLQKAYGEFGLNWGYASSPLLHEGKVIVEVLHGFHTDEPSYVVAFDGATGKVLWRRERVTDAPMESPDAYTTPIVAEVQGRPQIVISGADCVTGHDPATGEELWRVPGLNPRGARNYRIVASPLAAGGMIYAPTRERPLLAIRAAGTAERAGLTGDDVAWRYEASGAPDVPTPACDGTRFYMIDDAGLATCLNARTGEVIWGPERTVRGTVSSSPLLADGKVYFTNEEAVTVVLEAGDEFKILATNQLDGSYTLASPVPSGKRLFIRTGSHLYCIGSDELK